MNKSIALAALAAVSAVAKPEAAAKPATNREEKAAAQLAKFVEKLTNGWLRKCGRTTHCSMRDALVTVVKAVRVGATAEQLTNTGVQSRYPWPSVSEAVRVYANEKAPKHADLVFSVLCPEAAALAAYEEANAGPMDEEPAGMVHTIEEEGALQAELAAISSEKLAEAALTEVEKTEPVDVTDDATPIEEPAAPAAQPAPAGKRARKPGKGKKAA